MDFSLNTGGTSKDKLNLTINKMKSSSKRVQRKVFFREKIARNFFCVRFELRALLSYATRGQQITHAEGSYELRELGKQEELLAGDHSYKE